MRLHVLVSGDQTSGQKTLRPETLIGLALSYNFLSDRNTCNFIGRPEEFWHDDKVTESS